MAYLTIDEIKTHLYAEVVDAIGEDDVTILQASVDGAIAEAKGYLHAWDIAAEFAKTGADRNALLLIFLKDIAVWHYINLANPGTDLKLRQDRYNAAIAWLKGVQRGDIVPDLAASTAVEGTAGNFTWDSNTKRENHI